MDELIAELSANIRDAAGLMVSGSESFDGDRVRYAKVTAVTRNVPTSGTKVSVLMGGTTIANVPVLSTYHPIVDDNALLLQSPQGRLIAIGATNQGDGWQTPTFDSPWANYATGFQTARFRREGDVVRVEGLVKTTTTIAAINSRIFTLPSGYRPAIGYALHTGGGFSTIAMARLTIDSSGQFFFEQPVPTQAYPLTVGFLNIGVEFTVS